MMMDSNDTDTGAATDIVAPTHAGVDNNVRSDPCSVTNTNGNKKIKSVSFNSNARMYTILHLRNYTNEEISSSWYCSKELKRIKKEAKETLSKMENGIPLDEYKESSQGLESFTLKGSARKFHYRQLAAFAVFDEQEFQEMDFHCDAQRIADEYLKHTYASHIVARARGVQYRMSLTNPISGVVPKRPTLSRQGGTRFYLRRVLSKAA